MQTIKVKGKDQHPVSTVIQSRVPMFLPVKTLNNDSDDSIDIEIINKNGKIVLSKCKLTQVHRNIIDVLFSYYTPTKLRNGEVGFKFTKYDFFRKYYVNNGENKNTPKNSKWLIEKLNEIQDARIMFYFENDQIRSIDREGIISRHRQVEHKKTGEFYYAVVFSRSFMRMFDDDLNIYSQKLTESILSLKHALTQALVRLVITNEKVNTSLEKLLKELGIEQEEKEGMTAAERGTRITKRAYRAKVAQIKSDETALRDHFGITLKIIESGDDAGQIGVFYEKHRNVLIMNPSKQTGTGLSPQEEELA